MNTPADGIAIHTDALSKSFVQRRRLGEILRSPTGRGKTVTALDRVDLEVRRGEVFGLLGPNGAGKTTLLKILSCLILPDSGRAVVAGHDAEREELAVKRSIGYVTSDERSFYWRLTGAQNLSFFARLYGVSGADIAPLVARLLERMELTEKADTPFSSYSSGMKQRLSIARALLHDPPILFLDEPTRSLDPVTARHIRLFVQEKLSREHGKTILLATHNLHEAAALCDRMAILSRARVRRVGRLDEFQALFSAGRRYRLITDRPVSLDGVARMVPADDRAEDDRDGVSAVVELPDGPDADLNALLAALAGSGARILELRRETPPLEELFHRLFDEHAAPAGPTGEPA